MPRDIILLVWGNSWQRRSFLYKSKHWISPSREYSCLTGYTARKRETVHASPTKHSKTTSDKPYNRLTKNPTLLAILWRLPLFLTARFHLKNLCFNIYKTKLSFPVVNRKLLLILRWYKLSIIVRNCYDSYQVLERIKIRILL